MQNRHLTALLLAAMLAITASPAPVFASDAAWAQEKCRRYKQAFEELLAMVGRKGVTEAFISGNRDFIAAGCSNGADVCPTSPKDFELANGLTIAAMGFGTASSFLPFVCRQG